MTGPVRRSLKERLYKHFVPEPNTGCWLWNAHTLPNGYGQIGNFFGKKRVTLLAHRASWAVHFGEIPVKEQVLHRCDVKACINPQHLFLGSQKENMRDMWSKNRQAGQFKKQAYCKNGHLLTEDNTYKSKKYRQCKTCKLRKKNA